MNKTYSLAIFLTIFIVIGGTLNKLIAEVSSFNNAITPLLAYIIAGNAGIFTKIKVNQINYNLNIFSTLSIIVAEFLIISTLTIFIYLFFDFAFEQVTLKYFNQYYEKLFQYRFLLLIIPAYVHGLIIRVAYYKLKINKYNNSNSSNFLKLLLACSITLLLSYYFAKSIKFM